MNPNNKFIITINRELGSGGRTVGRKLAEKLGVEYFDKAVINALQKRYNLSVEQIEQLKGQETSWWAEFKRKMTFSESEYERVRTTCRSSPARLVTTPVTTSSSSAAWLREESSVAGTKKESPKGLSLKWRLPTLPQRSAVPSAMLSLCCPRPSPLSAAPTRRRRAHRRPPRASDALREGYGATRSWDIKDMVSLKKVSLSFSSDHGAHEVIVELVASWEV